MTLVLLGVAVGWSASWPSWLAWPAVADGVGWVAVAALLASRGFEVSVSALAMGVNYLLALWVFTLAVHLWRRAGQPHPAGGRS